MSHMGRDCNYVPDEEEKEAVYKWGLEIRASTRKGLSKLKEEEELVKSRECLFVPKPKPTAGGDRGSKGKMTPTPLLLSASTSSYEIPVKEAAVI
ncbi:unnamed protein product [Amaranthus hypochondriacus]